MDFAISKEQSNFVMASCAVILTYVIVIMVIDSLETGKQLRLAADKLRYGPPLHHV